MRKQRKHYTAEEKVAIVSGILVDNKPVSKLCDQSAVSAGGFLPLAERVL